MNRAFGKPPLSKEAIFLIAAGCLAAVLRLFSFLVLVDQEHFFPKYIFLAKELMANGWVTKDVYAYAPLYQYFAGICLALFSSRETVLWVQMLLGVVNTFLIYFIARKCFGKTGAFFSVLLVLGYGNFIFYETDFLSETLVLTLNLLTAGAALLWQAEVRRLKWLVLAGICTGMSIIVRQNFILFVLFYSAFILLQRAKIRRWRSALARLAAFNLPVLFCVLPISIQNYLAGGDFTLVTAQGGYVFHASNNRMAKPINYSPSPLQKYLEALKIQYDRSGRTWDEFISRKIASVTEGRELSPSQASRFWHSQALREMALQPGKTLWLLLQKAFYFFHGFEAHDTVSLVLKKEKFFSIPWLPFGLISPLALLGMSLSLVLLKGRRGFLLPLFFVILAYFATAITFYVVSRFRLPCVPFFILFAGYLLSLFHSLLRGRRIRALVRALPFLLLLLILLNWPTPLVRAKRDVEIPAFVYKWKAIEYASMNEMGKAEAEYKKILKIAKKGAVAKEVLLALSDLCEKTGRPGLAEEYKLKAMTPESSEHGEDTHYFLAFQYWSHGQKERALGELRLAMDEDPFNPYIFKTFADLLLQEKRGSLEEAIQYYEKALERGLCVQVEAPEVYGKLSECYEKLGNEREARKYLEKKEAYSLEEIKKW